MPRRNQVNVRFSDDELRLLDELVRRGKERGYPDRSKVMRELAGFAPIKTVLEEDRIYLAETVRTLWTMPEPKRAGRLRAVKRRASH